MNELSIFDSLFDDVLGSDVAPVLYHRAYTHSPRINVYEEDDAYTLEMELPGKTDNDINIELNHNNLTISSKEEKNCNEEDKKKKYLVRECYNAQFTRSISVPTDVDEESIKANFKNGILTINMKKKESAAPKRIEIKAE